MKGALLAVLFTSVALCLCLEFNDWPSVYHHDEPSKVAQLQRNERNLNHPLLLLEAAELLRKARGIELQNEEGILACGRFVSAASMALTLGVLVLAASLRWGLYAGLAVGLSCGLSVRFYEVGHYFKEDTPFLLGHALTVLAMTCSAPPLLLGMAVGVAAASKYAGLALLPVVLVYVWEFDQRGRWCGALWIFGGLFLVLAIVHLRFFFMTDPFAVLGSSFGQEVSWMVHGHKGIGSSLPNLAYIARLFYDLGYHGVLLLGSVFFLRKHLDRRDAILLVYAVVCFFILLFTRKYSERYLLPVLLLALYYVGGQMAAMRLRYMKEWPWVGIVLLIAVGLPWLSALHEHRKAFAVDSRAELCDFLETQVPADAILVADDAAELDAAQRWLGKQVWAFEANDVVARLGSLSELKARGVTHILICYDTYYRYVEGQATVADDRAQEWGAARAFYQRLRQETPLWQAPARDPKPLHPGLELYAMPDKL